MMFDLKSIALMPQLLAGGVPWVIWREPSGAVGGKPVRGSEPPADQPWILIVPAGAALEREIDAARRPFVEAARSRPGGRLTDAEAEVVTAQAYGRAALRGWGNIASDGVALAYSEAEAIRLLSDARWRALRDFVVWAASQLGAAAAQEEEAAAGN